MEFGRLPAVDQVDFTLPADPPATTAALRTLTPAAEPAVRLGAPQWRHPGYLGRLYPPGTPQKDWLAHYARQFPTVELNTTFYGVRPEALARWRQAVPAGFTFCPKLPKTITHDARLVDCAAETAAFVDAVEAFGEHLGPAWALLPESFGPRHRQTLCDFIRAWPGRAPLGVELRHPGWFAAPGGLDAVGEVCAQTGAILVLTDVAGRRDVLHMRVTAPTVILRFIGNRLHPTDFTRIDAWAERLAAWLEAGVRTVYVFLHQPEEELNLELAERFGAALRRTADIEVQVPERVTVYEQGSLF